jgi:phosphoenolpyruvate carboxykinase (ATP)
VQTNLDLETLIQRATTEETFSSGAGIPPQAKILDGVLFTWTGTCTGRSPNAKRFEFDVETLNIDWTTNTSISPDKFDEYWNHFRDFLDVHSDDVYLETVEAVRDPRRTLKVNVYTEYAQHAAFAKNMFVPRSGVEILPFSGYEVYHFPSLLEEEPVVLISIAKKKILISGTLYSGEIKKSVFSVLNYHFPMNDELPMHCSVNVDKDRSNPAVFFGLSGTGKTTLSSDPNRILIGDDEHAWTADGLTNFEGGCYAKTINLSKEDEPEIWKACHTPGTIIENVELIDGKPYGMLPDFNSSKYSENGRASYSTTAIPNADVAGYVDDHPKNVIMLTCDAFGVLPPVVKLDAKEAIEQFILGYTAKVAGTEAGITEPVATFSPCFGGPFMPYPVSVYADILKNKIEEHGTQCWLVNTGWTGGPYGTGKRISIKVTRSIIDSILDGTLNKRHTLKHLPTGLTIPSHPDIELKVQMPELSWESQDHYNEKLAELLELFEERKETLGSK